MKNDQRPTTGVPPAAHGEKPTTIIHPVRTFASTSYIQAIRRAQAARRKALRRPVNKVGVTVVAGLLGLLCGMGVAQAVTLCQTDPFVGLCAPVVGCLMSVVVALAVILHSGGR